MLMDEQPPTPCSDKFGESGRCLRRDGPR